MANEPANPPEPQKPQNESLGVIGERMVAAHLKHLGWRILATRYRGPLGEIDIIAEEPTAQETALVFVEVKARRSGRQGAPGEAVDARKQAKLIATAQHYLAARDAGGAEPACRFDVAEVFISADGLGRVVLHRAAFGLP